MDYRIKAGQVLKIEPDASGRNMVVAQVKSQYGQVVVSLPEERLRKDGQGGYHVRDKQARTQFRSAVLEKR